MRSSMFRPKANCIGRWFERRRRSSETWQIDPVVKLHYVELPPPNMRDQACDLTRLRRSLEQAWSLKDLTFDLPFLQRLSAAMRSGETYGGDWRGTIAIREEREAIAVWPQFRDRIFGVAFDVGTTTIAGHLCDLQTGEVLSSAGMMNPQIRFGEDLMSRISYLQQNEGQAPTLTAAVRSALSDLVSQLVTIAQVRADDVVEATIVGNPTMHHLVLGIDPTQLGMEPFPLVVDTAVSVKARDIDLPINAGGYAYFFPASPATSAPTPPGSYLPKARIYPTTLPWSLISEPTLRSFLEAAIV